VTDVPGARPADWARPVVHWALSALDPDRMRAFYSAMFNWSFSDGPFMLVDSGIGGPVEGVAGHIQQGPADRKGFSLYIQVRDIAQSQRQAVELGGAAHGDPFTNNLASVDASPVRPKMVGG
jgi:predicted enzyme related to lactoylglutathione lyase